MLRGGLGLGRVQHADSLRGKLERNRGVRVQGGRRERDGLGSLLGFQAGGQPLTERQQPHGQHVLAEAAAPLAVVGAHALGPHAVLGQQVGSLRLSLRLHQTAARRTSMSRVATMAAARRTTHQREPFKCVGVPREAEYGRCGNHGQRRRPVSETRQPSDVLALMRSLRAIRQFEPDPIPDAVLQDLLAVARWSGSAVNRQPWELIVLRGREQLRALGAVERSVGHLAGAALGLVVVMANANPEQETFDEGRLAERIMLAAWAHGVASCIGWFHDETRDTAKALLGVPPERLVRTVLSLGYATAQARQRRQPPGQARKPVAAFVYEGRYGTPFAG
jgi:nitroreductase